MVGAGGGRWSVSDVVGGRCFAFLLVGGRFLFLRMVCVLLSIWSVVGGSWSLVCGLWSVGGGFVLRPNFHLLCDSIINIFLGTFL